MYVLLSVIFLLSPIWGQKKNLLTDEKIEKRISALMQTMTLEEKIGQLNQIPADNGATGPTGPKILSGGNKKMLSSGLCGSMLNLFGAQPTREAQEIAVNGSRLHIPLLFGYDVIHGYKTIFPIPLAEAASWDVDLIEKNARIAAKEASSAGIHWTFAPMVDVARDARWGRVMEGAGEDPYLGSLIAQARVKGFQENLSNASDILACAKHYVAYGAAIGGRDYNGVDISERTLYEVYLPPFKAAADAGVATFMSAFNELNGIPASANAFTIRQILKKNWKFQGFVVSDWNSIGDLIPHGIAENRAAAANAGITAGVDMDMCSFIYIEELAKQVRSGIVKEYLIDDACRRILRMKFKLGLFEDPYKYCSMQRENADIFTPENRAAALDAAHKSIVLLKNEKQTLPITNDKKTIAVIGPLADDKEDMIGNWSAIGEPQSAVSLLEGLRNKISDKSTLIYAKGCNINDQDSSLFKNAVQVASRADFVILALGESKGMTGENCSRADIGLPGMQLELAKVIVKTGKPVIVVFMNGRPLAIPWFASNVPAIVEGWLLGTEAGNALADVLFGSVNPSGKLPVSFPYAIGQVPIYYNFKSTGRPFSPNQAWTTSYLDVPNEALYPFGFGLSYTKFCYGDIQLSSKTLGMHGEIKASIEVKNEGNFDGDEVVQLYIRDVVARISRPVKELKHFKKYILKKENQRLWTLQLLLKI